MMFLIARPQCSSTHSTFLGRHATYRVPESGDDTHLASLGPERGLQLAPGQQAGLQAGQEGKEVAPGGELEGRSLDAILADQHQCSTTVSYGVMGEREKRVKGKRRVRNNEAEVWQENRK